jgi:hypothetical protein
MSVRDRLRDLLAAENLTEWELAERLGLHRGSIVSMLANDRKPDALECLLLAGYCADAASREFWLRSAAITEKQKELLAKAVGNPEMDLTSFPPATGVDVATFLDFVANAHPERRKAVQAILREWRAET